MTAGTSKLSHLNQMKSLGFLMGASHASVAKKLIEKVGVASSAGESVSTPTKRPRSDDAVSATKARKEEAQESSRSIFAAKKKPMVS